MLATLTGDLCLLAGLAVLLLPLLATELSRPRDGAWGAVILLLGLVLVTSSDRLRGAPMLGVVCAGLLISRLATEVGQARWRDLSEEERKRLRSHERWATSVQQLTTVLFSLGKVTTDTLKSLKPAAKTGPSKRWVRPESPPSGDDASSSSTKDKKETNTGADSTEPTQQTNRSSKQWVRSSNSVSRLEVCEVDETINSLQASSEANPEEATPNSNLDSSAADNTENSRTNPTSEMSSAGTRNDED